MHITVRFKEYAKRIHMRWPMRLSQENDSLFALLHLNSPILKLEMDNLRDWELLTGRDNSRSKPTFKMARGFESVHKKVSHLTLKYDPGFM